jgi:hypothetical protein
MEVASYAMAAGGIVLVALALRAMIPMRVAYRIANAMFVRLAGAGNIDRAEKLCKAAPGTYLDAIAAAMAAARATGSTDLVTLAAASRPAFDAAGAKHVARWRTHANLGLVGAMLLAGGFALDFDAAHLRVPLAIGAGIGVLVAAWIAARRGYADAALSSARSEVLPLIEQGLAGSAATPPPPADADRAEKARRISVLEAARRADDRAAKPRADDGSTRDDPATRESRRDALVEAVAAPVTKRATASLRSGSCPLCKHTEIRTMSRTPGFLTYICGACGYTQEFAEL